MKNLLKVLGAALATQLVSASAFADAATFNYGTATANASQTGMAGFINGYGGTFLLLMVAGGVIGLAWIGVELMFFDKEIRDVKKGLIGAAIMVVAPAAIYAGIQASTSLR